MTFPVPGGSTFLRARDNLSDVANAAAALANLGAASDNNVTTGYFNVVKQFGADPTGTNLCDTAFADAAAALLYPAQGTATVPLPAGGALYIEAGTYLLSETLNWKIPGLRIVTDGPGAVVFVMQTANIPIVQLAGAAQVIGDISLAYQTQQTSAQTGAIAVELGDDTIGSCFLSEFKGLRIYQANTGIAINPAVAAVAGVFSCWFGTIAVNTWSLSAGNFNGNNGGGLANCTGCTFDNIYLGNTNGAGTQETSASYGLIFQNWDELTIRQLNIEHCTFSAQHALAFATVGGATIDALHFEALTLSATGKGLLYASHAGTFTVNAMTVKSVTYNGASENPVVFFNGTGPTQVTIDGFNEVSCTVTTPSHPLADFGSATNCTFLVSGIAASQTTANTVNAGSGDTAQIGAVVAPALLSGATFTGPVVASGGLTPASAGWTCWPTGYGVDVLNNTSMTSTTMVAGTIYYTACYIGSNCTLTGIMLGVGTTAGTDEWIAILYSASGAVLANSSLSGIAVSSTVSSKQKFAFTGTYAVTGPGLFYIGVQSNGTTAKIQTYPNVLEAFIASSKTGNAFGTLTLGTPASGYTQSLGPAASTY